MYNEITNITGSIINKKNVFNLKIEVQGKKKKIIHIKNFYKNKKNLVFIIGYLLDKSHKECSVIKILKNKIKIESDFFNSVPIYFYRNHNKFLFSNNIFSIHKEIKKKPEFNLNNLANYYIYGYEAFAKNTIYKNINFLNRCQGLTVYLKNKKILLKKERLVKNLQIKKKEGGGRQFEKNISNIVNIIKKLVQNSKTALLLTGGLDSMVVLKKFSNLNNMKTFFIGKKNSNDYLVGKQRAKNFKKDYQSYPFTPGNQKNLIKQINEYSRITSGIGTCTEIVLMQLVKKIAKNHKYVLMGYGGELYRNYLKNRSYFLENFITPNSTLKKFIQKNFYQKQLNKVHKYNYDERLLNNFYLKERYSKNVTRKNNFIRQFLLPINFFANQNLYISYIKKNTYGTTRVDFQKNFEINSHCHKINKIDSFNIELFFKSFKKIIINSFKNKNFYYLGIKQNNIINYINKNKINKRDCWFLLRILNLITYINSLKKNTA
jgi:hypothetical protein